MHRNGLLCRCGHTDNVRHILHVLTSKYCCFFTLFFSSVEHSKQIIIAFECLLGKLKLYTKVMLTKTHFANSIIAIYWTLGTIQNIFYLAKSSIMAYHEKKHIRMLFRRPVKSHVECWIFPNSELNSFGA